MTNDKKFLIRFLANVEILGVAEMNAESKEDAETKAKNFLEMHLQTVDVDLDLDKNVSNDINLKITEIQGVTNVNSVTLDGVADITNPEDFEKNILELATAD